MKFRTAYNRPPKTPEVNSGETLVEIAGYIPAQKRIENMILAGQRLVDYRKSQFDFEGVEKIDYDFNDPSRSLNFDVADATQIKLSVTERLKRSQKRQEASLEAEKAKAEEKAVQTSEAEQKA